MTYEEWKQSITEMIKIRATNYRLTTNDITYLIEHVYNEIAVDINLDFLEQPVVIDQTVDTYDLDALYTQVANELPMAVLGIKDEDGYDIKGFRNLHDNVWKYDKFVSPTLEGLDGKTIIFTRALIPDLETLSDKLQRILTPAIIEGIVYYTEDALPNPTASNAPVQEEQTHYKKYYNAKNLVLNRLPQRR